MNPWDTPALIYAALQRFYVFYGPQDAERAWQEGPRFDALPEDLKSPGHWYRYDRETYFIEIKPDGSGQFHENLSEGVDPKSVVVIPSSLKTPSLLDRLTDVIRACYPTGLTPEAKLLVDQLSALADPRQPRTLLRQVAGEMFSLISSDTGTLIGYLDQKLAWMTGEGIGYSKVTGRDVAAMFLIHSLAHELTSGPQPVPSSLLNKIFDPTGVDSLSDLVARFIADCFNAGFGARAIEAIKALRKGADGTLQVGRELTPEWEHPGFDLDRYYNHLFQAGIRFMAAWWGYKSATVVNSLGASDRGEFDKRLNTAEEKLVRVNYALLYAIEDLGGTKLRQKQELILALRAQGKTNEADMLLSNLIDSQLFYPPFYRSILTGEAPTYHVV